MNAEFRKLKEQFQKKQYAPVYLLHGEEAYYVDALLEEIENNALSEAEKSFNQYVLYGKDSSVNEVVLAAKRFPMMAERQVVIVKEAQQLNLKKDLEQLEAYLQKPLPSTILVLAFKHSKADKRQKWVKAAEKAGVVFESAKIRDYEVEKWISAYFQEINLKATPKAIALFADSVGNDLARIVGETEKMLINLNGRQEVNDKDIEDNIGVSREFNVFELQRSIGQKNLSRAQKIALLMGRDKKFDDSYVAVIAGLYNYFSKILLCQAAPGKSEGELASLLGVQPFFVKEYQQAARNFSLGKVRQLLKLLEHHDLRVKGVGGDYIPRVELLKEFIFLAFSA